MGLKIEPSDKSLSGEQLISLWDLVSEGIMYYGLPGFDVTERPEIPKEIIIQDHTGIPLSELRIRQINSALDQLPVDLKMLVPGGKELPIPKGFLKPALPDFVQ